MLSSLRMLSILELSFIMLQLTKNYIWKKPKSFCFRTSYRARCLKSYRFEFLSFSFCSNESREQYDSSLLLLVFYPSRYCSKLLWRYWHLSPYLQLPFSKKLKQSFVLYLRLRAYLSLIYWSLWAKAHWGLKKSYEFVKWTDASLVPESAFLHEWKGYFGFVLDFEVVSLLGLGVMWDIGDAHAVPGLF